MNFIEFIALITLLLVAVGVVRARNSEVQYVTSQVDGRRYLVRKLPDSQAAADMLARLNAKARALIRHLVAKHPENATYMQLYSNYDPNGGLSESTPEHGYTSFTRDKREVFMCLRQKDNSFADETVITYVMLHELTHVGLAEVGHGPAFWQAFKEVVKEAINIGVYAAEDYKANPKEYCGIRVTSSVAVPP